MLIDSHSRICLRSTSLILFLAVLSQSHWARAEWIVDEQAIMGTVVSVELWHEDRQTGEQAVALVMKKMRAIDDWLSPYKKNSKLSEINRDAAKRPVSLSPELTRLLQRSLEISELSQGAFDISFASVGQYYDYRKGIKPTDEQRQAKLPAINYRHIAVDEQTNTVRYLHPGVVIDLGGIAKGYAVDQGIQILKNAGIKHALVSAGGDSRFLGDRVGRPWMVGVKNPRQQDKVSVLMPIENAAFSTSGDYERFFLDGETRYHHILHPQTGDSAREVRSVSILGADALTTDALSTTVFVLGLEKGMALVDSLPGIDAVVIDKNDHLYYSRELQPPASR